MKHVYNKPKAILVDFHYDEQVTANSNISDYIESGHDSVGRCQYTAGTACTGLFNSQHAALCDMEVPWSLRP